MDSNYTRIYFGNTIEAQKIVSRLKEIEIAAIVKDQAKSARMGGFASPASVLGEVEVFVHIDELEKAKKVLDA